MRFASQNSRESLLDRRPQRVPNLRGLRGHEIRRDREDFRRLAISPDSVARASAFANVDVNEIIVRPTASPQLARISRSAPGIGAFDSLACAAGSLDR